MPAVLERESLIASADFSLTKPKTREDVSSQMLAEINQVEGIQKERDFALNIQSKGSGRIRDSYDWALERAKHDRLETREQREAFQESRAKQLETVLRERYHVAASTVYLSLDKEGNAYDPSFPDEPFDNVILRGVVWALTQNSPEMDREQAVLEGWVKSRRKLADPETPIGAKMVSLSPQGMVESTTYNDHYVDILEAVSDPLTGKRMIKKTRFASGCNNSQYFDMLVNTYPDFPKLKGPFDALALANPIYSDDPRSAEQIFKEDFAKGENLMTESDFEEIWDAVKGLGESHLDALFAEYSNPVRIQLTFNAFLHKADEEKDKLTIPPVIARNESSSKVAIFKTKSQASPISQVKPGTFVSTEEEIQWRGRQEIAVVIGGCGKSGGISLNRLGSGGFSIEYDSQFLRTSPGSALNLAGGEFGIGCKDCGKSKTDNHYHCPKNSCKQRYSDETNVKPEHRTKNCKCGFKFGC